MNIAAEKQELIRQFNDLQDLAIIRAIRKLLQSKESNLQVEQYPDPIPLSYAPQTIDAGKKKYIKLSTKVSHGERRG